MDFEEDEEEYKPLDNDWINEFEKIDKDYCIFYNEDLQFLKIHSVYINTENIIEQVKEEKIIFKDKTNAISRDNLLGILKNNSFNGGKRYFVLSILKYNIDIQSIEIKDYVKSREKSNFLSVIKNIDTISYKETINMFQDLNDLIILFYEKSPEEQKNTWLQRSHSSIGALTKKVYIKSNHAAKKRKHRFTNKYIKTL
jgi:hypothetical protein